MDRYNDWKLTPEDPEWPSQLNSLENPPTALYGRGDPNVLGVPSIAVIGARRATPYGLAVAELAAKFAAEHGIVVVSGGAMGCDSQAHEAALAHGGKTVIVADTGPDYPYPGAAKDIFRKAWEGGGCVVSLREPGSPPSPYAFLSRNRVIAALSSCLFLAEAGKMSSTFDTADKALGLGRTVLAAPGSIFAPTAQGTNRLIAQGAVAVAAPEDIDRLIGMHFSLCRYQAERDSPLIENPVLAALIASPSHTQDLADSLSVEPADLLRDLTWLEAQGAVVRLPDGSWSPSKELLSVSAGTAIYGSFGDLLERADSEPVAAKTDWAAAAAKEFLSAIMSKEGPFSPSELYGMIPDRDDWFYDQLLVRLQAEGLLVRQDDGQYHVRSADSDPMAEIAGIELQCHQRSAHQWPQQNIPTEGRQQDGRG